MSILSRQDVAGEHHSRDGVRRIVAAALCLVVGVGVLWAWTLRRQLAILERDDRLLHNRQDAIEQSIGRIRSNVLLGAILVRDLMLDGTAAEIGDYRREFSELQRDTDSAIHTARAGESVDEAEEWLRLRSLVDAFWASRALPPGFRKADPMVHIRTRLVPRRAEVLAMTDELERRLRASYAIEQQEAAQLYRATVTRSLLIGSLALGSTAVIGFFLLARIGTLEARVRRHHARERRTHVELEHLSARLVEGQDEERRRLARELHDTVGQALLAIRMDIGTALRTPLDGRSREALVEATHAAERTLQGIRDLSQVLHPSLLDDFGLVSSLIAYAERFTERTGITATLDEDLPTRLPADQERCMYWIAIEALTNVSRHSGATQCTLILRSDAGGTLLRIEDNGRGLPETVPDERRGIGLIAMRERVHALGGLFSCSNGPRAGTRVDVRLPGLQTAPRV